MNKIDLTKNDAVFFKKYAKVLGYINKTNNVSIETVNNIVLSKDYFSGCDKDNSYIETFLNRYRDKFDSIRLCFKLDKELDNNKHNIKKVKI